MGLFGPKKTFMDYVRQRPPEVLRTMGLIYGFLHIELCCSKEDKSNWHYDAVSGKSPVMVMKDTAKCYSRYTVFNKSGERLPRRYRGDLATGQEWLEWACEMGDPDAPFYLSLMYEYGMTHEAVDACGKRVAQAVVQQHRDPEQARQYMALAEERKSKLYLAYMALSLHPLMKRNNSEGAMEDEDYRLYNICRILCENIFETRESVEKIVGEDGYRSLCRFLGVLLGFYAGQEFPGCLGYISILLTKLLRECSCHEDVFAQKYAADFFKNYFLICREHVQETLHRLVNRIKYLQASGNRGVLFMIEDLGMSFETVKK